MEGSGMHLKASEVWRDVHSNAIEALKLKTVFYSPTGKPYEIIDVTDDSIEILRKGRKGQPSPCPLTEAHVTFMVGLLNAEGGILSCEDERLQRDHTLAARIVFAHLHPQLRIVEKMLRKDGGRSNHIVVVEAKAAELIADATSPQSGVVERPTDVIQDSPPRTSSVPTVDTPQSPESANHAYMDLDTEIDVLAEKCEANGDYDASNEADAREFEMRAIAMRRGQPRFRERLINAYEGKCAVTDCSVHQVLEAAHIKPFCENQNTTYVVSNGILLRSDIHTLFDQYLMGINPDDFTLTFAEPAMRGKYKKLNGKQIKRPDDDRLKPSRDLLRERWLEFCSRNAHAT
jgi:hypothetical protein